MSEAKTRPIFVEFPSDLARQVKVAIYDRNVTMRQWMEEAAREKLRRESMGESAGAG